MINKPPYPKVHESILHNDLLTSFPETLIDADTAWKAMSALLDHEMPAEKPKHFHPGSGQQLWSWIADLLLIATGLFILNNPAKKERHTLTEVNGDAGNHAVYHHSNLDPLRSKKTSTAGSRNPTIAATHLYDSITNSLPVSKNSTNTQYKNLNENTFKSNEGVPQSEKKTVSIENKKLKQTNSHILTTARQHYSSGNNSKNDRINKVYNKLPSYQAPVISDALITLERTTSVFGIQLSDLLQHPSNIAPVQDEPFVSARSMPGRRRKALVCSFGLQWQAPVPVQGTDHYSTGFHGQQAPYQYLLPGAWLEFSLSAKRSLLVQASYGHPLLTGRRSLSDTSGIRLPNDTSLGRRNTSLLKLKGFDINLSYQLYITSHWSIGAGISYQYLSTALLEDRYTRIHDNKIIRDSLYTIETSGNSYLRRSVLSITAEAAYHKNRWALGMQARIPVTPVYKDDLRTIKPAQASLFIRWTIK